MKPQNESIDFKWLQLIQGKKLMKTEALIFSQTSSELQIDINKMDEDNHIQAINLEFEEMGSGRFFCGSNGSSICVDHSPLEEFSLNGYVEENIFSLHSQNLWINLINNNLISIKLIESELEKCIFAINFIFENGFEITIANLGDNLVCRRNLNPDILQEEKAKFIVIN
jgi:hypothetical protein